jgi:asparagine synthase (glutamine-hydrolysing)
LRPVLDERLAQERVARQGPFDAAAMRRLVDEHVAGVKDHRKLLWALLMLDAWCDEYRPTMVHRER